MYVVADTIGVDLDVVREGVAGGSTIAEIAEANGSSADAVVEALVARVDERLEDAVAADSSAADSSAADSSAAD
jgi:hypothetical protein